MDKARYFEFVYRLPERNREELSFKEAVYDKQIELNEDWGEFAARKGRGEAVASEEHVKWITETWEEFEERKRSQKKFLKKNNIASDEQQRISEARRQQKEIKSNGILEHVMKYQRDISSLRTPCRHNLFVDFQSLQQDRFHRERNVIETEEYFLRSQIEEWESCQSFIFSISLQWSFEIHDFARREREALEEAERQRLEEERKRAEEERIRIEEQRKRDEEEAERQRREQAEIDKRLERKKREEMRRAKSRAQRQSQSEGPRQDSISEAAPETKISEPLGVIEAEQSPTEVEKIGEPEAEKNEEPEEPKIEEPEAEVQPNISHTSINFRELEGNNIVELLNSATAMLSSGGDQSYIMAIKSDPSSTVISENGLFRTEDNKAASLLGKSLHTSDCVSIASRRLHNDVCDDIDKYLLNNVERIGDVREDERCCLFVNTEKDAESLVLFPIAIPTSVHSPFVVALCRKGVNSISDEEVCQMGKLVFCLGSKIRQLVTQSYTNQLCQQCVDWLSLCLGCENVYISLGSENPEKVVYIAATSSQRFLLGTQHTRSEELNGSNGITFQAIEMGAAEKKCVVSNFEDVSTSSDGPLQASNIRFFQDAPRKGPLLMSSISGCRGEEGISFGCVFADRLGSTKVFTAADQDVMRTASQLLADILLGNISLNTSVHLKVEDEVEGSSLTFLKILWERCVKDVSNISSSQLLELAKYLHPPPVIPRVIQSTLLIVRRCKPQKIAEWENARKKVTQKLLKAMAIFDPTNMSRTKNAFFIRARRIVKGLSADEVFNKGSYPTQCFFSWLFAAILLRKQTIFLLKKDNELDFYDDASFVSQDTEFSDVAVSDDDGDDDGEDDGEDDDDE